MPRLKWKTSEPAPSPFDAVFGELYEYVVHFTTSKASHDDEIRADLSEIFRMGLSVAPPRKSERARKCLIKWDPVHSDIEFLYTGREFEVDYSEVTKARFVTLDEQMNAPFPEDDFDDDEYEKACDASRQRIKRLITEALASTDLSALPKGMSVYYTDDHDRRNSCLLVDREHPS